MPPEGTQPDGNIPVPPRALFDRPDLLHIEAERVHYTRKNWRGRLAELGDYGTTGGSGADRRAIVEWMAAAEARR